MPVYERKEYFLEALNSAINQTVTCKIIVVDNCSSHNYFEEICTQKGIQYYRNEKNIGMAANFSRCIKLAKTEYVMNLQDDDIISPIYVESFVRAKKQHPDIDIYFSDFVRNAAGLKLPHSHILPWGYMNNGDKVIEYAIKYKLGFPFMSSCIKRELNTDFYTKFIGSYDWLWIYSNADKFTFFGDSKKLYEFRDHELQDTTKNALKYSFTIPYLYDKVLKEKTSDIKLKKKASAHAFWGLVYFKSIANNIVINEFINNDTIYSKYLIDKRNKNRLIKTIYILPRSVVNILYKTLRKIWTTYDLLFTQKTDSQTTHN